MLRAAAAALLFVSGTAFADELEDCAKLANADDRLACYDKVAKRELPPEEASRTAYLTRSWKLGPNDGGVRRMADITTYRPNYILLRYTSRPNLEPRSPSTGRAPLTDLNKTEIEVQASFKTELMSRAAFDELHLTRATSLIGFDSMRLWFAYTQGMGWQTFNHGQSRPIRETDYEPELILTLGRSNTGNGFKLLNLGFSHQSNGLDQLEHRGWSRLYAQGGWDYQRFSILGRVWRVVNQSDDDNPNIRRFMGSGDVVMRYESTGGYVTSSLLRHNFDTGRGLVQLDWATPVSRAFGGLKFHAQISSGYGITLLDYNHQQWTAGIGVSFGD
ncbi:MAG: phospholipase A [Betaproteobacteria bacterium]|nr:phospholipase A [Betaproteobacteria bacterium]MBV9360358.1 phospholipase A [Betaproteobacteria bacterium]